MGQGSYRGHSGSLCENLASSILLNEAVTPNLGRTNLAKVYTKSIEISMKVQQKLLR